MIMFNKQVYIARRQKLKQQLGKGLLLFLGNEESSMNYKDNWYHFRQDSSFLYFFGLDKAGLAAVIDVEGDKDILLGGSLRWMRSSGWARSLPSSTRRRKWVLRMSGLPLHWRGCFRQPGLQV